MDEIPDYNLIEELLSSSQLNEANEWITRQIFKSWHIDSSDISRVYHMKGIVGSTDITPILKAKWINDENDHNHDEYSESISEDESNNKESIKELKYAYFLCQSKIFQ